MHDWSVRNYSLALILYPLMGCSSAKIEVTIIDKATLKKFLELFRKETERNKNSVSKSKTFNELLNLGISEMSSKTSNIEGLPQLDFGGIATAMIDMLPADAKKQMIEQAFGNIDKLVRASVEIMFDKTKYEAEVNKQNIFPWGNYTMSENAFKYIFTAIFGSFCEISCLKIENKDDQFCKESGDIFKEVYNVYKKNVNLSNENQIKEEMKKLEQELLKPDVLFH